jgi:hypothetical protein
MNWHRPQRNTEPRVVEIVLNDSPDQVKARTQARLLRQTTQRNDGVAARADYDAETQRLHDRTAALREQRKAREAAEAEAALLNPPKARKSRATK